MEIPVWVWIIVLILGMYYLRFYQPQVYTPIMDLVDTGVKMLFDAISGLVGTITHKPLTNSTLPEQTAVNTT